MAIKIRKLVGKDVRILAGIMAKELPKLQGLAADAKAQPGDDREIEIGLQLAASVLTANIDALWEWLASLADMTAAELDSADAEAPFDIIAALLDSGALPGFFAKVQNSLAAAATLRIKSGTA